VTSGKKNDKGIFVSGDMYLHRGGLNAAWAAAMGARSGENAGASIVAHLKRHRTALGMNDAGKALAAMGDIIDTDIEGIENIICNSDIVHQLVVDYKSEVTKCVVSDLNIEDKTKKINEVTNNFAKRVAQLVKDIVSDLNNEENV
jgi:hypothetical protein